jgi:hypothetical protein
MKLTELARTSDQYDDTVVTLGLAPSFSGLATPRFPDIPNIVPSARRQLSPVGPFLKRVVVPSPRISLNQPKGRRGRRAVAVPGVFLGRSFPPSVAHSLELSSNGFSTSFLPFRAPSLQKSSACLLRLLETSCCT